MKSPDEMPERLVTKLLSESDRAAQDVVIDRAQKHVHHLSEIALKHARPGAERARVEAEFEEQQRRLEREKQKLREFTPSIPRRQPYYPNTQKPRIYIAGPMRGYPEYNFPAFDKARDAWAEAGWEVISPADMDRMAMPEERGGDKPVDAIPVHVYVERDVNVIKRLRAEHGDAMAMLPGWTRSTGARAEYFLARWLGLAIHWAHSVVYPGTPSIFPEHAVIERSYLDSLVSVDRHGQDERAY